MKKLIITDLVQICGLDLTSGTLDEKHKYMEYDTAESLLECWIFSVISLPSE
jgi:hypothetical protein